ncbi:hypothetical protein F4677DRAFT_451645 [Hypoxylon crocopeplum]|nr:hypothetical protein F4677DRAFT_451645 [Hypoxylon crocopeplum]
MAVDTIREFSSRIEEFQTRDHERIEWMKTIHAQLAEVTQNYSDAAKDLKRERMVGRITQDDAEEWKQRFLGLQKAVERSSFVLVLIDADSDAYQFKSEYYSSISGGRKAALELRDSVRKYLRQAVPDSSNIPIVVKAFANADGLSQQLIKCKIIKTPIALWDFAKGFSQSSPLSDFVLVGAGKDRADKKIEGMFEQFVENPTCRYTFLGACHDNGYVRLLEKYNLDDALRERVILLHSFDVGREFSSLSFKSITMDEVFGSKPQTRTPVSPSPSPSFQGKSERGAASLTWAKKVETAKPAEHAKVAVSVMEKDLPPGVVLVNVSGQRVDSELAKLPQRGLDGWHHKTKVAGMKYCRMYHLQGSCKGNCGYSHGELSADEKLVYRSRVRREACHVGAHCRDPGCFYGHNCSCKQNRCAFSAEMHCVDSSTASIWQTA